MRACAYECVCFCVGGAGEGSRHREEKPLAPRLWPCTVLCVATHSPMRGYAVLCMAAHNPIRGYAQSYTWLRTVLYVATHILMRGLTESYAWLRTFLCVATQSPMHGLTQSCAWLHTVLCVSYRFLNSAAHL